MEPVILWQTSKVGRLEGWKGGVFENLVHEILRQIMTGGGGGGMSLVSLHVPYLHVQQE